MGTMLLKINGCIRRNSSSSTYTKHNTLVYKQSIMLHSTLNISRSTMQDSLQTIVRRINPSRYNCNEIRPIENAISITISRFMFSTERT